MIVVLDTATYSAVTAAVIILWSDFCLAARVRSMTYRLSKVMVCVSAAAEPARAARARAEATNLNIVIANVRVVFD